MMSGKNEPGIIDGLNISIESLAAVGTRSSQNPTPKRQETYTLRPS